MNTPSFQESVTNAIRYWERGRIAYNAALSAVVAGIFAFYWPSSGNMVSADLLLGLFALCILANVAYCAAYPVDLLAQSSGYRMMWLRVRWVLLLVGIVFAGVIAQFIARGVLGDSM